MKRRPGPSRLPTNVRALRGNAGHHRPVNRAEPQPAAATTEPPRWLDRPARAIYAELAPELHRLGLLTVLDRQALAGACRWWAVYRTADATLKRALTATTPNNGRQAVPEMTIATKAFANAMAVFAHFGVTPSERTRLVAPGSHDDSDDFEQLLARREAKRPS